MKILYLPPENIHMGNLILVNRSHPYVGQRQALIPVQESFPSILMERCAVILLTNLMMEIRGWRGIVPVSGWRSPEGQKALWDNSLTDYGMDFTKQFVAYPGCSEHQTGLAIDLGERKEKIDPICPDFPDTGLCSSFRENAPRYGFIERYPRGKEDITGIGYEPWHFRYVGAPHALIMKNLGLTLEEYTGFLKNYPYGERSYSHDQQSLGFSISYLKASEDGPTRLAVPGNLPYSISGNNIDGFIITEWRKLSCAGN